ncbi:hypothetical protein GSVR_36770 [Geobacter sp. SVR]|nr:hypothetical protein GSVR_36770 [Geobacter sp. SVR]
MTIPETFLQFKQGAARPDFIIGRTIDMPTYDYRCQQCGRNFSVTMHIAEHDQQRMTCPDCKGVSIVQQYSTFFARTSKKS